MSYTGAWSLTPVYCRLSVLSTHPLAAADVITSRVIVTALASMCLVPIVVGLGFGIVWTLINPALTTRTAHTVVDKRMPGGVSSRATVDAVSRYDQNTTT